VTSGRQALIAKAIQALKWNVLGVAGRVLLQLVVMVVMARLVGPADFGIFGICTLVLGLAMLVADLGLGVALVQRVELDDILLRRAWGRTLLSHMVVAGLVIALAPMIAEAFGVPGAVPYLYVTALTILASAILPSSTAVLRRALDFRALQRAQLMGYGVGFGLLGCALALAGFGAWSFVLALLVQQILMGAMILHRLRFRWVPAWSFDLGGMQAFGLRAVGSNIANWTTESLPNAMVGRHHGATSLGLYGLAYNLARTPTNHLVTTIQQLLLSATSRVQSDQDAASKAYLAVLRAVALASFPMFLCAAAVPSVVVLGMYGPKWQGAVAVFVPIALAMPFHAIMAVAGPVLWGRGQTGIELRIQVVVAIGMVVLLLLVAHLSFVAVAWAVLGIAVVRAVWLTLALAADLALPIAVLARTLWPPLVLGACLASLSRATELGMSLLGWTQLPMLIGMLVSGLVMLAIALRLFGKWLLGPELGPLVARMPPRVQRWLGA
jgi:O-antigen/teichoic acid export membrane protein